jgi:hypothetical protein
LIIKAPLSLVFSVHFTDMASTTSNRSETAQIVFGFAILIVAIFLSCWLLRFIILWALDRLTSDTFTSAGGKLVLSIVLFAVGYGAFEFKMHARKAFAFVQIAFALAANWVALGKVGTELIAAVNGQSDQIAELKREFKELNATVHPEDPDLHDATGANTNSSKDQPGQNSWTSSLAWLRLVKLAVLGQCLFLVCNGFGTLLEKGREAALRDVKRLGKSVGKFVDENS